MALILMILFGLGTAFFATQNTGSVHILIGNYIFRNIPLYVVVVGSILFGVFISWIINLVDSFTTFFALHAKETMLRQLQIEIDKLQTQNSELEKELAELKDVPNNEEVVSTTHEEVTNPQLFNRLKKNLKINI